MDILLDSVQMFLLCSSARRVESSRTLFERPAAERMRSEAGFAGQKDLYMLLYNLVYNEAAPEGVDFEEVEDGLLDDAA